ncbi:MAG: hypothetical protein ACQKBY_07625 [Verrucomicrobiales bacterium]
MSSLRSRFRKILIFPALVIALGASLAVGMEIEHWALHADNALAEKVMGALASPDIERERFEATVNELVSKGVMKTLMRKSYPVDLKQPYRHQKLSERVGKFSAPFGYDYDLGCEVSSGVTLYSTAPSFVYLEASIDYVELTEEKQLVSHFAQGANQVPVGEWCLIAYCKQAEETVFLLSKVEREGELKMNPSLKINGQLGYQFRRISQEDLATFRRAGEETQEKAKNWLAGRGERLAEGKFPMGITTNRAFGSVQGSTLVEHDLPLKSQYSITCDLYQVSRTGDLASVIITGEQKLEKNGTNQIGYVFRYAGPLKNGHRQVLEAKTIDEDSESTVVLILFPVMERPVRPPIPQKPAKPGVSLVKYQLPLAYTRTIREKYWDPEWENQTGGNLVRYHHLEALKIAGLPITSTTKGFLDMEYSEPRLTAPAEVHAAFQKLLATIPGE